MDRLLKVVNESEKMIQISTDEYSFEYKGNEFITSLRMKNYKIHFCIVLNGQKFHEAEINPASMILFETIKNRYFYLSQESYERQHKANVALWEELESFI